MTSDVIIKDVDGVAINDLQAILNHNLGKCT